MSVPSLEVNRKNQTTCRHQQLQFWYPCTTSKTSGNWSIRKSHSNNHTHFRYWIYYIRLKQRRSEETNRANHCDALYQTQQNSDWYYTWHGSISFIDNASQNRYQREKCKTLTCPQRWQPDISPDDNKNNDCFCGTSIRLKNNGSSDSTKKIHWHISLADLSRNINKVW